MQILGIVFSIHEEAIDSIGSSAHAKCYRINAVTHVLFALSFFLRVLLCLPITQGLGKGKLSKLSPYHILSNGKGNHLFPVVNAKSFIKKTRCYDRIT